MKIIKKEAYRSQPCVNVTDDMVRVTLSCTRNEWRRIEALEAENARLVAMDDRAHKLIDYWSDRAEKEETENARLKQREAELVEALEKVKKRLENSGVDFDGILDVVDAILAKGDK